MGMMHIDANAPVLHCDEVDSTNTCLARAASADVPTSEVFAPLNGEALASGCVLWADHQTHGRGRDGRVWLSSNDALTFSMLVEVREDELEWLTALAGLALLRTIEATPSIELQSELSLKWPNDLLLGGRKLAGILCEHLDSTDSRHRVIIGVGLNIGALPSAVEEFAVSLQLTLDSAEREAFIRSFRTHFTDLMSLKDPTAWREAYTACLSLLGQECPLHMPGGTQILATPISVNDRAELVCRSRRGGIFTVTTGELSPTPLMEGHLS